MKVPAKNVLTAKQRFRGICLFLVICLILFVWELGSTGLVDETPPLFAAAARAMSESGDWLTPKVNGLNRFDKPPLTYWLMGFFYSLPNYYLLIIYPLSMYYLRTTYSRTAPTNKLPKASSAM